VIFADAAGNAHPGGAPHTTGGGEIGRPGIFLERHVGRPARHNGRCVVAEAKCTDRKAKDIRSLIAAVEAELTAAWARRHEVCGAQPGEHRASIPPTCSSKFQRAALNWPGR